MTTSETTSFMLRIYKSMRLLELTTTDKYFEETCSITRPSEWQRFGWYMENASHAKIFVVISTFRLIRRLQRCIVCDRWSRWWVGGSQSMATMVCNAMRCYGTTSEESCLCAFLYYSRDSKYMVVLLSSSFHFTSLGLWGKAAPHKIWYFMLPLAAQSLHASTAQILVRSSVLNNK